MKKIARFEKVSFEQFKTDVLKHIATLYTDEEIKKIYDEIKIPTRATTGSAGYDFKCPFDNIIVDANDGVVIPTGIRAKIDDGWVLNMYPRSGLGFKHGVELANTVGIIDSDYYNSDNEGHIMIKLTKKFNFGITVIDAGKAFAQGVFNEYGITDEDDVCAARNGGFGSTGA